MNPKDVVFASKDLLHYLLDFLPSNNPIDTMTVSKGWKHAMNGYRLPHLSIDFRCPEVKLFCRETSLHPSRIYLSMDVGEIKEPSLIQIIEFCYTSDESNHDILFRFPNLFELIISSHNCPKIMHDLPVTLRRLTIGLAPMMWGSVNHILHSFDGSNLLSLISLDLSSLWSVSKCSLPPNIEVLYMPKTCLYFPEPGFLPPGLKKLVFQHVGGKILPKALPPQLTHLQISTGFNGDIGILPPSIAFLDLGKDFKQPLEYLGKLRSFTLNSHVTAEDWNPHITRIKMDNVVESLIGFHTMPSTLTELEFNVSTYFPFISENLPYSIRSLTLHVDKNYSPVFFKRPPHLRSLTLCLTRNINFTPNDLPESITSLILRNDGKGVQTSGLNDTIFPPNLQYLSVYCLMNEIKTPLPASLTFLELTNYNSPFNKRVLPEALTTLCLDEEYSIRNLCKSWFPKSLDYIDIGTAKLGTPRNI